MFLSAALKQPFRSPPETRLICFEQYSFWRAYTATCMFYIGVSSVDVIHLHHWMLMNDYKNICNTNQNLLKLLFNLPLFSEITETPSVVLWIHAVHLRAFSLTRS